MNGCVFLFSFNNFVAYDVYIYSTTSWLMMFVFLQECLGWDPLQRSAKFYTNDLNILIYSNTWGYICSVFLLFSYDQRGSSSHNSQVHYVLLFKFYGD